MRRLDSVLLLGLGLLALALRLPEYQHIPAFTDERNDIMVALRIARGEGLPLTNDPAYIGSLWNYVLAAAFWIVGESLLVPRTVVLVVGVLGVLAAYPLGRRWGGRWGGALTALLVATSAGHIAFTSRVAWSHSTTPLFVTIGTWALVSAAGRRGRVSAGRLVLAGLAWGLAFQTHPTVLALLPGLAIFVVLRRRPLLASRWLYVAALLFVFVNLNLLIYNLRDRLRLDRRRDRAIGRVCRGRAAHGTAVPGARRPLAARAVPVGRRCRRPRRRPGRAAARSGPLADRPARDGRRGLAMATRQSAAGAPGGERVDDLAAGQRQVQSRPERPLSGPVAAAPLRCGGGVARGCHQDGAACSGCPEVDDCPGTMGTGPSVRSARRSDRDRALRGRSIR